MTRRGVLEANPLACGEVFLDVSLWVADRVRVRGSIEGRPKLTVVSTKRCVKVRDDLACGQGDLFFLCEGSIGLVLKDRTGVLELVMIGTQHVHPVPPDSVKLLEAVKRLL